MPTFPAFRRSCASKTKIAVQAAALTTAALLGSEANATVTVSSTLNQTISATGGYSGEFDISSLLTGSDGTLYTVVAATLTASAYSDAVYDQSSTAWGPHSPNGNILSNYNNMAWTNPAYSTGGHFVLEGYIMVCTPFTVGTGQNCKESPELSWVPDWAYNETNITTQVDTTIDQMKLAVDGQTATGSVSQNATTSTVSLVDTLVDPPGNFHPISNATYNIYQETDSSGYDGVLSSSLIFDAASLGLLNDSKVFDYALTAPTGQYQLTDVGLSLELAGPINAVPEPASWALTLAGLGIMGALSRRCRTRA